MSTEGDTDDDEYPERNTVLQLSIAIDALFLVAGMGQWLGVRHLFREKFCTNAAPIVALDDGIVGTR